MQLFYVSGLESSVKGRRLNVVHGNSFRGEEETTRSSLYSDSCPFPFRPLPQTKCGDTRKTVSFPLLVSFFSAKGSSLDVEHLLVSF